MKNPAFKIMIIVILSGCINFSNAKANYITFPASSLIDFTGSDSFFTELVCNLQFTNFNNTEIKFIETMAVDATLELETWMFETDWADGMDFIIESELQVENWMVNYHWTKKQEDIDIPELKIEAWMENPVEWNTNITN